MPEVFADRAALLQQLEGSEQAAAQLLAGTSQSQLNWQPANGSAWSIWQCIDHLARTNRVYCQAMAEALAHASDAAASTSKITPGWFARLFIAKMEPPARTKFKSGNKVAPSAQGDAQIALTEFNESHVAVRQLMENWRRVDLNRVRFKNPFVPMLRFTVGAGLMIINAHDRRHLWQATNVKQCGGYPAA